MSWEGRGIFVSAKKDFAKEWALRTYGSWENFLNSLRVRVHKFDSPWNSKEDGLPSFKEVSIDIFSEHGDRIYVPYVWMVRQGHLEFDGGDGRDKGYWLNNIPEGLPVELRPFQREAFAQAISTFPSALIQAPMGSGKSWIAIALLMALKDSFPALLCGKGQEDTRQLYQKLLSTHLAPYVYYVQPGKKVPIGVKIIVSSYSSLHKIPLESIRLFIADEVHCLPTSHRIPFLLSMTNLQRAYGLSATIGMRQDKADQIFPFLFKEVISTSPHFDLQKHGLVAPTKVFYHSFQGQGIWNLPENHYHPRAYTLKEALIELNPKRALFAAAIIKRILDHSQCLIVFCPTVRQANLIAHQWGKLFPGSVLPILHSTGVIMGKTDLGLKMKTKLLEEIKNSNLSVCICTDFINTGFDCYGIDAIFDVSGQSSAIASLQRAGRGTRPKSGKELHVHVLADVTTPIFASSSNKKIRSLCQYFSQRPINPRWDADLEEVFPKISSILNFPLFNLRSARKEFIT